MAQLDDSLAGRCGCAYRYERARPANRDQPLQKVMAGVRTIRVSSLSKDRSKSSESKDKACVEGQGMCWMRRYSR